jgi:hypothetical protein
MGFDQEKTTHHFRLAPDGGAIEVEANEADDAVAEQVATHLRTIRDEFSAGDFRAPRHTHAEDPPGVPILKRRRLDIGYAFERTPRGGRVAITTRDPEALAAIHAFLRYQIDEHRTGDPKTVEPRRP